jgi:3-deoxy-D-manno-octulosonate 8-phosphate phosphatase (KDO 8-P phosphatase)
MSPLKAISPDVLHKAKTVQLLLLDVDGVLTEGGLLYTNDGEQTKCFNTLDGHGIKLLQASGIKVAIISGRDSQALRKRLADVGIENIQAGVKDKKVAAEQVLHQLKLSWAQVAAMGDDWPDLPMLTRAVFSCAPPNAHHEVLNRVDWITHQVAGHGAVREVCDLLLHACGKYDHVLQDALT